METGLAVAGVPLGRQAAAEVDASQAAQLGGASVPTLRSQGQGPAIEPGIIQAAHEAAAGALRGGGRAPEVQVGRGQVQRVVGARGSARGLRTPIHPEARLAASALHAHRVPCPIVHPPPLHAHNALAPTTVQPELHLPAGHLQGGHAWPLLLPCCQYPRLAKTTKRSKCTSQALPFLLLVPPLGAVQ